jgi:hypothetical protein
LLEERCFFSTVSCYIPCHIEVNFPLEVRHVYDLAELLEIALKLLHIYPNHNPNQSLMTLANNIVLKELKLTQKTNFEFSTKL